MSKIASKWPHNWLENGPKSHQNGLKMNIHGDPWVFTYWAYLLLQLNQVSDVMKVNGRFKHTLM